ncbi:MAG: hypothetical protein HUJ71_09365 [Pseudobutyrivibrio sp.]|nr:hypothetical protein [Pseudobutyrivibrio sp.]
MFESNDTFIEEAVKRYVSSKELMLKRVFTGIAVVSGVLAFVTVRPLYFIFLILCVVSIVFAVIYSGKSGVDYEYDYTNGSLDIAKIMNNSRRKEILSIEASSIKTIVPADSNQALGLEHQQMKVVDVSSNNPEDKTYIMVAHNDKKGEDIKVIWNPSEKLLKAIMRVNKSVTI